MNSVVAGLESPASSLPPARMTFMAFGVKGEEEPDKTQVFMDWQTVVQRTFRFLDKREALVVARTMPAIL